MDSPKHSYPATEKGTAVMGYTKEYLEWALEKFGEEDEDLGDFLERWDEGGSFSKMGEFTRDRLAEVVERDRGKPPRWDAFLSYAGEHRDVVSMPLAQELRKLGLTVWFDQDEYPQSDTWNGILYRFIHEGIALSRVGVVVVSPEFVAKDWPKEEYSGLRLKGASRLFLVLHNADSGTLAALDSKLGANLKKAGAGVASTAESSIAEIAQQIAGFINGVAESDRSSPPEQHPA